MCFYALFQKPAAGNSAVGYIFDSQLLLESALNPGARVGPKSRLKKGTGALVEAVFSSGDLSTTVFGPWQNVKNRYLGLKFKINDETHYGWARLNVELSKTEITATLTGYAYETIPNKPIIAGQTKGPDAGENDGPDASLTNPIPDIPQPASLGALALGAPGLSIWRRREWVGAGQ